MNPMEFKEHVAKSANEMLDEMDATGNYNSKYDVTILTNGKYITLGLNADLHEGLLQLMDIEIDNDIVEYMESNDKDLSQWGPGYDY